MSICICKCHSFIGRFMFERIHNTKEQIYFYERVENHKAKEQMFKSSKWGNSPGKHPDEGLDHGFPGKGVHMYSGVVVCWFISFILNIPWK